LEDKNTKRGQDAGLIGEGGKLRKNMGQVKRGQGICQAQGRTQKYRQKTKAGNKTRGGSPQTYIKGKVPNVRTQNPYTYKKREEREYE